VYLKQDFETYQTSPTSLFVKIAKHFVTFVSNSAFDAWSSFIVVVFSESWELDFILGRYFLLDRIYGNMQQRRCRLLVLFPINWRRGAKAQKQSSKLSLTPF